MDGGNRIYKWGVAKGDFAVEQMELRRIDHVGLRRSSLRRGGAEYKKIGKKRYSELIDTEIDADLGDLR